MRKVGFIVSVLTLLIFSSCKKQLTCAAYHSYFLLNDEAQAAFFSPFGEDSLPRNSQITVKKNGNGITGGIDPKSYKRYHYFVPMQDVLLVDDTVAVEEDPIIESDKDGISTSPESKINSEGGEYYEGEDYSDQIESDDYLFDTSEPTDTTQD